MSVSAGDEGKEAVLNADMNSTYESGFLAETNVKQTDSGVDILKVPVDFDVIFEFWIPGVILNIVGILGLMGNLVSIFILSRPQMKSSINCILIGLSSFDIILITTSILMFGITPIYEYSVINGNQDEHPMFSTFTEKIYPFITPVVYPIGLMAQTGSVYLTVCVTIERYVAVCRPLKAKSLCTYGRARLYVLIILVFSVLYNLPRCWEITRVTIYSNETERNITKVVTTDLRNNPYYIEAYINWSYLIFMYLIPFTVLALFNFFIYMEVRKANCIRAQLSRNQKREIGLAMMLFCVVTVFFLCNILALVVNILEHFGETYYPLTNTSNLLVTLNSSVNFVIYCIFGEKFKRLFLKTLCVLLGREDWTPTQELMRYPNCSFATDAAAINTGNTCMTRCRTTPRPSISSAVMHRTRPGTLQRLTRSNSQLLRLGVLGEISTDRRRCGDNLIFPDAGAGRPRETNICVQPARTCSISITDTTLERTTTTTSQQNSIKAYNEISSKNYGNFLNTTML